jgi:hypothetical protein
VLRAGAYALRHLGNDGSDLFRRLDMDGDGRITFPEFAYVMLQGEDDDDDDEEEEDMPVVSAAVAVVWTLTPLLCAVCGWLSCDGAVVLP